MYSEVMARVIPNKYAGNCTGCGARVGVSEGHILKVDGKWAVEHNDGACPTTVSSKGAVVPAVVTPAFAPTEEQETVRTLFRTGQHLVVEAGAGCGKTATLIILASDTTKTIVATAFNRKIVDEIGAKFAKQGLRHASAKGIHQLAFAAVGRDYKSRINGGRMKSYEIAKFLGLHALELESRTLQASFLASLTQRLIIKFCSSADAEITERHMPFVDGLNTTDDDGKIDYTNQNKVAKFLVPFARKAWADLIRKDGHLPFSPAVYLKLWQLGSPSINAEVIFFDEAQDTSPVMLSIIEQQSDHAQIVAVGDSCQSINEWMGAINALDNFRKLGANEAWLTQSFRFGTAVAEVANSVLARIEGATLQLKGFDKIDSKVGPLEAPKAILTRTNATAVENVLLALESGRKPFLVGGGDQVVSFARGARDLQGGRRTNNPELACFDNWAEVVEYVAAGEDGGDLKLMVKLITKFGVETILEALENQVPEAQADVVVSTTHKAKGLEWDTVQLAGDFVTSKKKNTSVSTADRKLFYVAVTRAKITLDLTAALGALSAITGATGASEEEVVD